VRAILNSGDGTTDAAEPSTQQQQQQQQMNDESWFGEGQLPLRNSDACGSPCAVVSNTADINALFNSSSSSSPRRASQLAITAAAALPASSVSPSSARRASVSAYLQGQQDLATTVSTGVPYLDSTGSSPRAAARASDAAGAAAGGGAAAGPASAGSNSRHKVIKEALAARLSDAGEECWLLQMHCCNESFMWVVV
jgi:hypothetical protein